MYSLLIYFLIEKTNVVVKKIFIIKTFKYHVILENK